MLIRIKTIYIVAIHDFAEIIYFISLSH